MKIRIAIAAFAAILSVPAVWAQTGAASHADPPGKVGALNMQAAITSTQEGKQAANELQTKFAPRQTELQNLQKQISDITTRLQNASNTLCRATVAASGSVPPVKAFESVMMSGTTSVASEAMVTTTGSGPTTTRRSPLSPLLQSRAP